MHLLCELFLIKLANGESSPRIGRGRILINGTLHTLSNSVTWKPRSDCVHPSVRLEGCLSSGPHRESPTRGSSEAYSGYEMKYKKCNCKWWTEEMNFKYFNGMLNEKAKY
ncbi:hypothetical protein TNCT_292601 [Trichonephila clavata]|uniref:Uncharacterized protein n=1 Tax=Trichonephila clavata TaxID=2740835 RepID=A0A8X6I5I9_TRICU|nr:hypothetical protein TNCT_292601 [Trichonephila clavata]